MSFGNPKTDARVYTMPDNDGVFTQKILTTRYISIMYECMMAPVYVLGVQTKTSRLKLIPACNSVLTLNMSCLRTGRIHATAFLILRILQY